MRLLILLLFIGVLSCKKKPNTLFQLLSAEETGIDFSNTIQETDSFNIINYEYIYNGGGVAIADFNNDGLQDIFFTGNEVPNRLYLNKGDLKFEDISTVAKIDVPNRWSIGVTIVDINGDGWKDIYVCATTKPDSANRQNMLFVHQGLNAEGEPVFKEVAADYNLNFTGHSVQSAFFDYDGDGDLDLYILVNVRLDNIPSNYRPKIEDGSSPNNDRLFKNNGDGTFTDVTLEAGIVYEGFGLGLSISDFNNDSWPDIYVSNDYQSEDILYINQKDGTFKNMTKDFIKHQSLFSMGNDAADINHDGRYDLITLDMLPENSERKKTTIGNKSYLTYINNEKFDYSYQFMRNMLHINNGIQNGFMFSEIGQLSGVYQTEWSWSPLMVDFDNDGWRDLLITNGFPKDITDKDFSNYRAETSNIASPAQLVDSIPVIKIPNYAFKNKGDLTFEDVSAKWGIDVRSFSNGAAFADLDNDGDLDYVVNNINSPAFVFKNTLNDTKVSTNYLRLGLVGAPKNLGGLGANISIYFQGKMQSHYHSTSRGYLSSVEDIVHFGVGNVSLIDSMIIKWPDHRIQILREIKPNQVITLNHKDSKEEPTNEEKHVDAFLREVSSSLGISYMHRQTDLVDFNVQRTLPHKYSQFGPSLAVGDINNDGLEDLFIGGSPGYKSTFYLQQKDGSFKRDDNCFVNPIDSLVEDTGALLFDFNNDSYLDLYLVKGGSGFETGHKNYRDLLYKNDGNGKFSLVENSLPVITTSGSCVRAADFDNDGDLDLFVGGRVIPGRYPYPAQSFILRNDNGIFVDVTDTMCPELTSLGMTTDAIWSDFDNDGKVDLIIAGELMPIQFFKNDLSKLTRITTDLDNQKGLWNSIAAGDFDNDGDMDYVVGNLGLNNMYHASPEKPVKVFAKDLDNNGSIEALTFYHSKMADGTENLVPMHFWDELNQQSPRFRKQFSRYKQFGKVSMETFLSKEDMEGALLLEVNNSKSSYIENLGNGKFTLSPLPLLAQMSPVNGMLVHDINADGNRDIIMVGNDFGNEVFIGRHDAQNGLILLGDGNGGFTACSTDKSGFYVPGDAKALVRLAKGNNHLLIASQNRGRLSVFGSNESTETSMLYPEKLDTYAILYFDGNMTQRIEFYYGSGYLSQASRSVKIPKGVVEVIIYNSVGTSRKILAPVQ